MSGRHIHNPVKTTLQNSNSSFKREQQFWSLILHFSFGFVFFCLILLEFFLEYLRGGREQDAVLMQFPLCGQDHQWKQSTRHLQSKAEVVRHLSTWKHDIPANCSVDLCRTFSTTENYWGFGSNQKKLLHTGLWMVIAPFLSVNKYMYKTKQTICLSAAPQSGEHSESNMPPRPPGSTRVLCPE